MTLFPKDRLPPEWRRKQWYTMASAPRSGVLMVAYYMNHPAAPGWMATWMEHQGTGVWYGRFHGPAMTRQLKCWRYLTKAEQAKAKRRGYNPALRLAA